MKTRIIIALCLGWLASDSLTGWGVVPPGQAPLPNLDKRKTAAQAFTLTGGQFRRSTVSESQVQAVYSLENRLPGLQVDHDPILASPALVTRSRGFLTGVGGAGGGVSAESLISAGGTESHRGVKAFLNENAALFGHDASVLSTAVIRRDTTSPGSGLHTVVWQQEFQGVPVHEAMLASHATAKGELARISSHFLPDVAMAAQKGSPAWSTLLSAPALSAQQAVAKAGANLGADFDPNEVAILKAPQGASLLQSVSGASLRGETYVQLTWLPLNRDAMRLCWKVFITPKSRQQMYRVLVDAETGEVLVRHNLTSHQSGAVAATYRVYTSDSPSPFSPSWPSPNTEQPPFVPRTLIQNLTSLNAQASPAGWLGAPNMNGAYETKGNNVDAHTDLDDDDLADTPRPSSAANPPVFDFTQNLDLGPLTYTNASVVQLFYWNNFAHDKLYELGFTESAGNFQNDNFGRGGLGNDAVQADALDGAALGDPFHYNNANFATPDDGFPGRMQMYVFDGPNPDRDGDLDAEIVIHEYVHGLTGRLVGGGIGIYSLQAAGMGEGWSDFYPLALLGAATDDVHGNYAVGGYATYQMDSMTENYYFGIRRYPYSTDKAKNPLTLKDIDPTQANPHLGVPISPLYEGMSIAYADEVHFQGEVWCVALHEVRANLIVSLGYEEGNRTALQLVTDAMKLCPVNPTFLQSRDAIIQADEIGYGGANRNEIWLGFAKRGMGLSARVPNTDTTIGVVEAFDVPDDVSVQPPTGALQIQITPADEATVQAGTVISVFVRVRDGAGVTNATVKAKVNGTTDLVFNNVGQTPDARPGDSLYSALLNVAANATNLNLVVDASAPGKTNATSAVSWYAGAIPNNDMFAGAAKIREKGGTFTANNKFASVEAKEPAHAGVATVANSLWWTWTPTNSSRALVDTASSAYRTVVAVYTGTSLNALAEVKSVSTVPERKQGYLFFDAQKGTNYYIAVASANTSSAGYTQLIVLPNGQPDITPPVVSVQAPASGLVVTNSSLVVVASAVDPQPQATGVDKFTYRVNPRQFDSEFTSSAMGDTDTTKIVLAPGRNTITVNATDIAGNTSLPVTLTINYRPLDPVNDYFAYATVLSNTSGESTVNNTKATREAGEPLLVNNPGGRSVWWSWKAPQDGSLLLTTEGSGVDTTLGLFTGDFVNSLKWVGENDDAFEGSRFSKLRQAVRAGQVYKIAADGFNAESGSVKLIYSFAAASVFSVNVQESTGGTVYPGPGLVDVEAGSSVTISALPDSGYEFVEWTGDISAILNPVSIQVNKNLTVVPTFRKKPVSDDFESGGFGQLPWVTGGDLPWIVSDTSASGGKFSARSGAISDGQSSLLSLNGTFRVGPGQFNVHVSSESNYDVLVFRVDGKEVKKWSGEVEWSVYQFALTAGEHKLEWEYRKDQANKGGLDAAFIDNLDVEFAVPVDPSQRPVLSVKRYTDGTWAVMGQGQPNQWYVIQAANALPGPWVPVSTVQAVDGVFRYMDPDSLSLPSRYYRAVTQ
jgi:hypothetical protein